MCSVADPVSKVGKGLLLVPTLGKLGWARTGVVAMNLICSLWALWMPASLSDNVLQLEGLLAHLGDCYLACRIRNFL